MVPARMTVSVGLLWADGTGGARTWRWLLSSITKASNTGRVWVLNQFILPNHGGQQPFTSAVWGGGGRGCEVWSQPGYNVSSRLCEQPRRTVPFRSVLFSSLFKIKLDSIIWPRSLNFWKYLAAGTEERKDMFFVVCFLFIFLFLFNCWVAIGSEWSQLRAVSWVFHEIWNKTKSPLSVPDVVVPYTGLILPVKPHFMWITAWNPLLLDSLYPTLEIEKVLPKPTLVDNFISLYFGNDLNRNGLPQWKQLCIVQVRFRKPINTGISVSCDLARIIAQTMEMYTSFWKENYWLWYIPLKSHSSWSSRHHLGKARIRF